MGGIIGFVAVIGVLIVVFACWEIYSNSRYIVRNYKRNMDSLDHFCESRSYISTFSGTAIALDEKNRQIVLMSGLKTVKTVVQAFSYSEILHCEVAIDGVTQTKTSRSSQLVGAAVGGALLGGIGVILGGLSGKKISSKKVRNIDLKIIVSDTEEPVREISFMAISSSGVDKNHSSVQKALNEANHWQALLGFLIKQADDEMVKNTVEVHHFSVADELLKLADLLDRNLISEDEYNTQKAKLLA